MLKEFKEFALRGNVVDMAVGIIIGAAFGAIVSSLVDNVIMPPIGWLMGGIDFSSLFINLTGEEYASLEAAKEAGAPVIGYGVLINAIIKFVIVAFALFLLIKAMNEAKKAMEEEKPEEAPTTKKCPECLSEIPIEAKRCAHCTTLLEPA